MDESLVLVTGATGQVGTAFQKVLPHATFLSRSDLDLADPGHVGSIIAEHAPAAVVNCAAYTNVDGAEQDQERARIVNGESVGEMARACAGLGIPFLTFSTDYVFDGSSQRAYVESDPVAPINAYGASKLLGEQLAMSVFERSLIVRTSWVVSATHDNFVSTMLRLAVTAEEPVRVVSDQRGRPTVAVDLALGAWAALQAGVTGVLHLANRGTASWFDLAQAAVTSQGIPPDRIVACPTVDYPTPARRPMNSVLDSERVDDLGLVELPRWQDSIGDIAGAQMRRLGLEHG